MKGSRFHGIVVHPGKGGESNAEGDETAYNIHGRVYGEAEKWAHRDCIIQVKVD